jgi:hypothetical protein
MVTRLPDPGMLPTSQEAGGCVHDNSAAMTAPGSQPGFDGGTLAYPASTDGPGPAMPATIPVSDQSGRDGLGRFTESSGAWTMVKGLSR